MKRLYFMILGAALTAQAYAQDPVILNSGFEGSFRTVNSSSIIPPVSISSVAPDSWYASDSLMVTLAPALTAAGFTNLNFEQQCFQDTVRYSGDYSVGLRSSNLTDTIQIAGMLSNASMSINLQELIQNQDIAAAVSYRGGTPGLGKKVDEVKAMVYLDTMYRKEGGMSVTAYSVNPSSSNYEAIGQGMAIISPDTGWQEITVTMNYTDPNFTATDTFVIVFMSSSDYTVTNDPLNYMLVDEVSATYSAGSRPTSIENVYSSTDVKIYPVPVSEGLHIDLAIYQAAKKYQVNIIGIDGKLTQSQLLQNAETVLDISTLNTGMYIVEVMEDNVAVFRQKITKQ